MRSVQRPVGKQPQVMPDRVPRALANLSTKVEGVEEGLGALDFKKANASTVGGLTTRVNSVEGAVAGKADTTAVTALAQTIPVPADDVPQPEMTGGAAGVEGRKVSGAGHRHPRLTSTTGNTTAKPTSHVIGSDGTVAISFTRTFDVFPGTVFTEVPPQPPTNGQPIVMPALPAQFRVESWVRDAQGKYTGCVVRAWRGQNLPTMGLVSGLLAAVITGINGVIGSLTGYNVYAGNVAGTAFTCIAVQRSDA